MTDPTQQSLEATRKQAHPKCISCSVENASGLALEFSVRDDRGVQAEFSCGQIYQGYPGFLHGGITSLLLDSAMANCLFAHQIVAVTARMIIRYLLPVAIDQLAFVKAWIREYEQPEYSGPILFYNEDVIDQPVEEIAALAKKRGIVFHTDAVQTAGKIPRRLCELGADLISISGHKFYGPKGTAALYIREGTPLDPLFAGGPHHARKAKGVSNDAKGSSLIMPIPSF
jgi:hypothetical protein